VEKATNKKWSPLNVQEMDKPGQQLRNGSVMLYKPKISQAKTTTPKSVESWKGRAPEEVIELNQPEQEHDRIKQQDRWQQPKTEIIREAPDFPKTEPSRQRTNELIQPARPPIEKEMMPELTPKQQPDKGIKPSVDKPIPLPKTELPRQQGRQIRPQPPVIKSVPKKTNNGKNKIPRNR
jgi:hypothetical protein